MTRLLLRPAARQDLRDIWLYSADQWGVEQAEDYIRQIEIAIQRVVRHPGMGSEVYGLPTAYRKVRSGSHRVIYRWTDHELTVVRIVHEREDVPSEWDDYW